MFNLDEMKRRLAEIDAERARLVQLINAAEAYEGLRGKAVVERPGLTIRHRSRPTATAPRSAPIMEATEQTVVRLVELLGRPVSTAQVVSDMIDRGLPVPERNPNNVISARLSNSPKIKGRRGFGWLPVETPWPDEATEMFSASETENPGVFSPRAESTTVEGREPDPRSEVDRASGLER